MQGLRLLLGLAVALWGGASAHALTAEQARAMASGDTDARVAALGAAAATADPALAAFAQALLDDAVKLTPALVLVVKGDTAVDASTGAPATLPADAEDVVNNNRMRGALQAAVASLRLLDTDPAVRAAAVAELAKTPLEEAQLPLIDKALAAEADAGLKAQLTRMRAGLLVASSDPAKRLAAAQALGLCVE